MPEERPAGASIESPIKEGVVFDDVCFSYAQPANGYTLEHISFHLKKGQVLGVIGATGSGKTTLIQLLQRFYPVDSGAIYIEGKNINARRRRSFTPCLEWRFNPILFPQGRFM